MQDKNYIHKKIKIGPMPFIDKVFSNLQLSNILMKHVRNERYVAAIKIIVKNILIEPSALYRIPEWASQFEEEETGKFGDDLLGRSLDKLFTTDRATLQTMLTLQAIKRYEVNTTQIHNDSTSVKFYGAYKNNSSKSIKLKRGHSKDHRPDLRQLIYNLSISADGAIPIHCKAYDGNKTDDTSHIETWITLRGTLGQSDFLYVADSKLCTSNNMKKIDSEKGRFVTIVPKTRSEVKEFYENCYNSEVRWIPLTRRESSREKGKYDVVQTAEGFYQLAEGFRVYWYRSSEKRIRDKFSRENRIELAQEKLLELSANKKRGSRTEKSLLAAAYKVIEKYKVSSWINVEVKSKKIENFKKISVGRSNIKSTYRKTTKNIPYLIYKKNHEGIAQSISTDGIFPLVTNTELGAKEVLSAYKYQPFIEKRFSCIKSDYGIAPAFLKKVERIEALMFVFLLADMVAAIIQREVRLAMIKNKIKSLKILPEERPTATPTWEQIQRLFSQHSKYELRKNEKLLKTFWDSLSCHQIDIVKLLGCKKIEFTGSSR
jgi:transposase